MIRLAIVKKYRSRTSEQEVVDQLAKLCWKIQDRRQAVIDRSRKDVRVLHVVRACFRGVVPGPILSSHLCSKLRRWGWL